MYNNVLEIAVSWPGLISYNTHIFFFHCCNRHRQLHCNYHLLLLTKVPEITRCEPSCYYTIKQHETGRKQLYFNTETGLYCYSNLVSITLHNCPIDNCCLHFEKLNVHLVSHHILTNFVNTQWPPENYFVRCKLLINRFTLRCMQTEMLALQDE